MKHLFVLLLLLVVVSVGRGRKCYNCIENCSEDDLLEMECIEHEDNCLSIIVADPDAKRVSFKYCMTIRITEEQICSMYTQNGDKCYTCDGDLCNKNDEK